MRIAACVILGLCAFACSDTTFQKVERAPPVIDDKVQIQGGLCTRSPESLVFPMRVLFVVDGSESMAVTDPPDPVTGITRREETVRSVWTGLFAQGLEDVRVGIIRFSAQSQSRTPVDEDGDGLFDTWFTADRAQLEAATAALSETDRTTNYGAALAEAQFEIRNEFSRAELESLPLSKYVVVFVSDGLPDVDPTDAQGNGADEILSSVRALRELAASFRVGSMAIHTVYLSTGQGPALDRPAQDLLQAMAEEGGGTYRSVPNGEAINFIDVDFSVIRRVFTLKSLVAVNLQSILDAKQVGAIADNGPVLSERLAVEDILRGFVDTSGDAVLDCGEPLVDSDGDGLADLVEAIVGSSPFVPDTDDDGLSDRMEWDLAPSRDPLDPSDAGCYEPNPCLPDAADPDLCACLVDVDFNGQCDCAATGTCEDADLGRDCVDLDDDGFCDCPDRDADGFCDYADRDGDGLDDCTEIYLGANSNGVDSDADGLPDLIEMRQRTSPVAADLAGDYDFDRTPNGQEVRGGTDAFCNDAALRSRLAYRYQLETLGLDGDRTCYRFTIGNITLVPTLANPSADVYPIPAVLGLEDLDASDTSDASGGPEVTDDADATGGDSAEVAVVEVIVPPIESPEGRLGDGKNRILVFAGEVAFDDPDAFADFRVACVEPRFFQPGNYKNPPSGKLVLVESDFVPLRGFDLERDCRRP